MPSLEHTLEDLLAAADAADPNPAKIKLHGGLNLNLRRDGNQYRLILWRGGVYPSIREWNIVCAHFPHDTGAPNPHKGIYKGRLYLQGNIPAHPKTSVPLSDIIPPESGGTFEEAVEDYFTKQEESHE